MMGMWCLLLLICIEILGGTTEERNEANILDIGGIFPIRGKGGWQGGQVRYLNNKIQIFASLFLNFASFFTSQSICKYLRVFFVRLTLAFVL